MRLQRAGASEPEIHSREWIAEKIHSQTSIATQTLAKYSRRRRGVRSTSSRVVADRPGKHATKFVAQYALNDNSADELRSTHILTQSV